MFNFFKQKEFDVFVSRSKHDRKIVFCRVMARNAAQAVKLGVDSLGYIESPNDLIFTAKKAA